MAKNIDELVNSSIKFANGTSKQGTLAEQLSKNADRVLGIVPIDNNPKINKPVRVPTTSTQTFSLTTDDIATIKIIKEKFITHREVVTKSEIIRIGIKLLSTLTDEELMEALSSVSRLSKNGW